MSGLLATEIIQRHVRLALKPALGIPLGATVPPEDDPARLHAVESGVSGAVLPSVTDAGSAIDGQSFQSRSIA